MSEATRRDFRELYRRTWELELLISGAVVFALLQLPGAVDSWFYSIEHQAGVGTETLAFLAYYVAKLILYTLIGAFLAHLCARALWVGLIGLDSVFPQGIVWERSESGPIFKRIRMQRTPSLGQAIERSDQVASVIFSAAFAIVLLLVLVALMSAVFGALALAAGVWLGEGAVPVVFWTLYMGFFLPPAIAQMLDKSLGGKLDPESRLAKAIERVIVLFFRVSGPVGRMSDAITYTLSTNLPPRRATVGLSASLTLLVAVFLVRDVLIGRGAVRMDGYQHFPDFDGPGAVLPAFYDSAEEQHRRSPVPSIQSEIVTEPYVRLFIPISASRLSEVVEERCPEVGPVQDSGLRMTRRPRAGEAQAIHDATAAVLACLEEIQRIELDGVALAPELVFNLHPRSRRRGVLTLIPTRELAPGRHTLTVHPLPRPGDAREGSTEPAGGVGGPASERMPWIIPFWI